MGTWEMGGEMGKGTCPHFPSVPISHLEHSGDGKPADTAGTTDCVKKHFSRFLSF